MRKALIVALVTGLLVASLGGPAVAKKKKKKAAKPIPYTFYLHGNQPVGEADYVDDLLNATGFRKMDTTEPADPAPKTMFVTNYVRGPNSSCSGNNLFPTWSGALTGKVVGDITVYLNAASHPTAKVNVDIFADGSGGCDSTLGSTGYVPPVATTTVELAPGVTEHEIVFEKVNFKTGANMLVMVTPVNDGPENTFYPSQARVLYDSPDFPSRVEFSCIPTSGKSCV